MTVLAATLANPVRADSVNSPNITLNVDTNRAVGSGNGAGNVSIVVNTITLAEISLPEYSSGTGKAISIKARPGFQFDPTSNITAQSATIGINGGGLNAVASVTPTGAANETITFNLTSGTNTAVQDIIRINGVRIRILNATGAAGPAQTTMSVTSSTAGGAFTDQGIVAANIQKGAANRLEFSIQPGNVQSGADILPAVKVVDFGGNIITTGDVLTITLALQANPGPGTLNGTKTRQTVNGVATWVGADDLNIATASNGYTLRASHSGPNFLTSDTVDSGTFNVSAGAPDHLVVSKQPVDTAAGAALLIDVSVFDAVNNPVLLPVNVTLDSAINPGGWPLLTDSSLTKTTIAGVASWGAADNLRINSAITGYKLSASGVGNPVETNTFNINPGAPALLKYVQQPSAVNLGALMVPPVTVEITDAFSNRTNSTANVKLSLQTAPCGGSLNGGSADAVAGVASFPTLTIDTGCTGDQLSASSSGLPSTVSDLFNVIGGAPCGVCGTGAPAAIVPLFLVYSVWRGRARRRKAHSSRALREAKR